MGYTASEALSFQCGQGDFDRIDDTDNHIADLDAQGVDGTPANTVYHHGVARWWKLYALTACTITTVVTEGGDTLETADVIPISTSVEGRFTEVKISAGVCLAYRG